MIKLNKAEKFVKRFKENNPDLNSNGCIYAIKEKLFGKIYQDQFIPPEYKKAIKKYYD